MTSFHPLARHESSAPLKPGIPRFRAVGTLAANLQRSFCLRKPVGPLGPQDFASSYLHLSFRSSLWGQVRAFLVPTSKQAFIINESPNPSCSRYPPGELPLLSTLLEQTSEWATHQHECHECQRRPIAGHSDEEEEESSGGQETAQSASVVCGPFRGFSYAACRVES